MRSQQKLIGIITAFACDPLMGSEPGAGWLFLRTAAQHLDEVILYTRSEASEQLESAVKSLPSDITIRRIATPFDHKGSIYLRYLTWVRLVAADIRERATTERETPIVLHHVTYAADWMPSPINFLDRSYLSRFRVVWGPVGGATYAPARLIMRFPLRFMASELVRWMVTSTARMITQHTIKPRVSTAIALNNDVAARFPNFSKTDVYPNFALDTQPPNSPFRDRENTVVFAGRPLEWKGLRLLFKALESSQASWELELYGGTAKEFSIYGNVENPRVRLMGVVDRETLLNRLKTVKVLVIPSLHDSASWIAAEAAASGCWVVCLNLGGPPTLAGGASRAVTPLPAKSLPHRLRQALDDAVALESGPDRDTLPDWSSSRLSQKVGEWYGIVPQCEL